jgi:hypothetical protein
MKKIFVSILLLSGISAFAQSDVIINTVTLEIAEGKYNDAEKYLDSLIKIDSNSIDAMMMKGNVLLNYTIMQTPTMTTITLDDESIYSQDLASLKSPTVLIPRSEVPKIEKLWDRCIKLDSGRLDIREGLCTLYGMADMKKELIEYLPIIAKYGREKGNDFAYALMQYAQLLSDRGDKEGSYEAYKKIAALYPSMPSIWCQLATAHSANGDLVNARIYADRSFEVKSPDMAACGDALDIYSVVGEYTKALSIMESASKRDSSFIVYPFYNGIYSYAHHDSTWRKKLREYAQQFPVAPDSDVLYNASQYMLSPTFKDDYNDFTQLLTFSNSDFYTALITEHGMKVYKDSLLPYLAAAELMVLSHNYPKANSIYAQLEKKKIEGEAKMEYQLQYAFSLYCAKEYTKSLAKWLELNKNPDKVLSVMGDYFIAQSYLKSGNKTKGLMYLQKVLDSTDETKYAYLAKVEAQKWIKK